MAERLLIDRQKFLTSALFLNRKTSKSSREGGIWGKAGWGNVTCPGFVPVQDFSLYILFILWNFFWISGYLFLK